MLNLHFDLAPFISRICSGKTAERLYAIDSRRVCIDGTTHFSLLLSGGITITALGSSCSPDTCDTSTG